MADRFWVGGTGTWNTVNTANWSATDGGSGGVSVPTSADDVYFSGSSGTGTVTISGTVVCQSLVTFYPTNSSVSIAASSATIQIYGQLDLSGQGSFTGQPAVQFLGSILGDLVSNGKILGALTINRPGNEVSLGGALTATNATITITNGTFTTNNYAVAASSLSSSNSNTRAINLGSSTVTLSGGGATLNFAAATGLTFNAGTSQINCTTTSSLTFAGGGQNFHNVSCTATTLQFTVSGQNTFNNLSVNGRTTAGLTVFAVTADQTINGTLTLSAGTNATMRTFVRSDTIGTTRTLTCAAVASLTDIDFRDITIAGAAAPVSGTRLGDCKGNSGITFDAAKTVYYRSTAGNWGATTWSFTNNGTADVTAFPLAQDTAVFPSSPVPYPSAGATCTSTVSYNIGTIDMSARTSNTMTLATSTSTPTIYGNWINGTGTTLTGTGTLTFAGRGSQTITSAGKTFTQLFNINTPGGAVSLADAFAGSGAGGVILTTAGTFDAAGYNVSLTGATSRFDATGLTRTVAIGSGTWTISGSGVAWSTGSATNLTVTGTGTISLTSASAKTFSGGGIQTYPTINQGGIGTLTITGSNKFANITNTAIGRVQFTGSTTNEFGAFNLNGVLGNLLQVGSTNTTQAILKAPSWNVGLLSTDAGNNTGLSFTGVSPNYLSISYINGQISASPITSYLGNFFAFF